MPALVEQRLCVAKFAAAGQTVTGGRTSFGNEWDFESSAVHNRNSAMVSRSTFHDETVVIHDFVLAAGA